MCEPSAGLRRQLVAKEVIELDGLGGAKARPRLPAQQASEAQLNS